MLSDFLAFFNEDLFANIVRIITVLSPIWFPLLLWSIFWRLWKNAIRSEFFFKQKYIVLEIKLPKETMKSPKAMELFLVTLHQTGGEGTWYDKYWLGRTRPWYSLEMASFEGQVKFFIWTREPWKKIIEAGLYANFPNIEVYEVPDYTKTIYFDKERISLWGCDFVLTKPDPYPIKTYVDYGLDADPKEEFKVDPMTNLVEFLGSVGQGEYVWYQIIVRAHKEEARKAGFLFKKTDKWKDEAKDEIKKIKDEATRKIKDETTGKERPVFSELTPGQTDVIKALERSVAKLAFDVGMRGVYIARRDKFNPINISGLTGAVKQFNSENLNGFKVRGDNWNPQFSYPWQDFKEIRQNRVRGEFLEAFKRRSFFFDPYVGKCFVLNTEELATVFHFPGQVLQTPTVTRITSKKAEAPANLPI
jgi:hypothetical protein